MRVVSTYQPLVRFSVCHFTQHLSAEISGVSGKVYGFAVGFTGNQQLVL